MVLHLGVAAMAISAVLIYVFTLCGADYYEFIEKDSTKTTAESISINIRPEESNDGLDDGVLDNATDVILSEKTPLIIKNISNGNEEVDA